MRRSRHELAIFEGGPRPPRLKRRRRWGPWLGKALLAALFGAAVVVVGIVVFNMVRGDPVHLRVVGLDLEPVAGAVVTTENGATATTNEEGATTLNFRVPGTVSVTAPGHKPASYRVEVVPRQGPLSLQMEPYVLQGRVVDAGGAGLVGATVSIDGRGVTTGEFGAFELVAVDPGPVVVKKAAWETTETTWDGEEGRLDVVLEPFVVRGVRVFHRVAGSPTQFDRLMAMIEGTVINALVIDTKNEDGLVLYDIDVPAAHETGAVEVFFDAAEILSAARARDLYAITRVVAFQDNVMVSHRPELAVRDSATGGIWRSSGGMAWLDPTNRETWEYPISLGVAACRVGFDEVQFDYVRFPSDGGVATATYSVGPIDAQTQVNIIADFLAEARQRIHAEGCAMSADIFAIVLSTDADQGVGQRAEELSAVVDVISPMIYPSHYSPGWLNLNNPNDHPATVVAQALDSGMPKIHEGTILRPWLQAFAWTADQIMESIATAERREVGWMLWNSTGDFQPDWFPRP